MNMDYPIRLIGAVVGEVIIINLIPARETLMNICCCCRGIATERHLHLIWLTGLRGLLNQGLFFLDTVGVQR